MAVIKFGGGVASASGSVGGTTYSHNRGGPYMRSRVVPTNPGTPKQIAVRSILSQLTSLWLSTLTAIQRISWDTYAENVLLPNPLGEPRNVGGLGMYVRSNVPRLQSGLPRVDTAPSIFNLGAYTEPAIGGITAPTSISLSFDNTDAWANEDDAAMLVYGSRGQNVSINYFKGPYRVAGLVVGDAITPPTSPAAITSRFTLVAGQRAFVRAQVTRADGRLSADWRGFSAVV